MLDTALSSVKLNPAALDTRELESQITELAGHLNAANHRWLVLIAEFDRREGSGDGGFTKSCAHRLNWGRKRARRRRTFPRKRFTPNRI